MCNRAIITARCLYFSKPIYKHAGQVEFRSEGTSSRTAQYAKLRTQPRSVCWLSLFLTVFNGIGTAHCSSVNTSKASGASVVARAALAGEFFLKYFSIPARPLLKPMPPKLVRLRTRLSEFGICALSYQHSLLATVNSASSQNIERPWFLLSARWWHDEVLQHAGVLKVLQSEGIPIDYIVGNSMGAIVGWTLRCRRSSSNGFATRKILERSVILTFLLSAQN